MKMFFGEEKDWKDYLSDDDRILLERLLNVVRKHDAIVEHAENPIIAKLWVTLLEMRKEMDKMQEAINVLSEPWRAVVTSGDSEKRRAIERIVSDIVKPTDSDSQEA